jgi:tryptophan synthase alpha chain
MTKDAAVQSRISRLFETCSAQGRKAFIAYLTAGDPTVEATVPLVLALERGGTDLIELGVPFSDPIADGPVIQRASERALRNGVTLPRILTMVRQIRQHSDIPILLFSYLNPLMRYGFDALAKDAAEAGVDGVLLTDLSVEEAEEPVRRLREHSLDTVFLAAPTSSPRRLELVGRHSSGFVYLVSRTGVTGEQAALSHQAIPLIQAMREHTSLPLALGFGISQPEHVAAAAQFADGVVVGSALVKLIETNKDALNLPELLEQFTSRLTSPLREKQA